MPARPAFLRRIPDVIASLRSDELMHDQVDAEVLKRCLFLSVGDAARRPMLRRVHPPPPHLLRVPVRGLGPG